jgi:hypothetical protein
VPKDSIGHPNFGWSVRLSSDGRTLLVGGNRDNSGNGSAWIFTQQLNGTFAQTQAKFTSGVINGEFGISVSLSPDGNTALIGARFDNGTGAVYIYTRAGFGSLYTPFGSKLTPKDASGSYPQFGNSVALSADGLTAVIGGSSDASHDIGATWVFTLQSATWKQYGSKLVGTGYVGTQHIYQGWSVAISANGSTIISGAYGDNNFAGSAFVFALESGAYVQQARLVGASAGSGMGWSVSLDAAGVTAFLGAPGANRRTGSTWIFGYIAGTWTAIGLPLVGSGAVAEGSAVQANPAGTLVVIGEVGDDGDVGGASIWALSAGVWMQISELAGTGHSGISEQGSSVAMSSNGSLVALGGNYDDGYVGAVWVFKCGGVGGKKKRKRKREGRAGVGAAFSGFSILKV